MLNLTALDYRSNFQVLLLNRKGKERREKEKEEGVEGGRRVGGGKKILFVGLFCNIYFSIYL